MSNIEILSAVHGIAPRSNELLRLGTDLDRGRVEQEVYDEQLASETAAWLDLQTEAGIDIREDGKLGWHNHLQPIVTFSNGFSPNIDEGPLTRWFNDNRFFRQPAIIGRLSLNYDYVTQQLGTLGDNVSLLSPSSFANLCDDRYPELPAERNVLQLYADLFFYFEQNGVKRVLLEDYLPSTVQREDSLHYVKSLVDWNAGLHISLISPSNQVAIPRPVDPRLGIGIEARTLRYISTQPDYVKLDFNHAEIWHQVIDASDTKNDDLEPSKFPIDLFESLSPVRLILTHSVDLECLPLKYAQDKVKHLGEFVSNVRERVAA